MTRRLEVREQVTASGYILVSPDNDLILRTLQVTRDAVWVTAAEQLHACRGTLEAAGFVCARVFLTARFKIRKRP